MATTTTVQEIGDVESWAKTIESEMRTVATALELLAKDHTDR